jgi:hypothetical protein
MNCADITTLLRNAEKEEADDTPHSTDNAACKANEIANASPLPWNIWPPSVLTQVYVHVFSALGFNWFSLINSNRTI